MTELMVREGGRRRLTGDAPAVQQRAQMLERQASRLGLATDRQVAMGSNNQVIMVLSFYPRPVPRRWYQDWRAVAAVSVCTMAGTLGCAYALYRAILAIVAGVLTGLAILAPVGIMLVGAFGAVAIVRALLGGGGGRTFSGTFRGKMD
jgi:hypothetical protein